MKKMIKVLLVVLLMLVSATKLPVQLNAQEVTWRQVSAEEAQDKGFILDNEIRRQGSSEDSLMHEKELKNALPNDAKVRVVIELVSDPLIVEATHQGVNVDELSQDEVEAHQSALLNKQTVVKEELLNENVTLQTVDPHSDKPADESFTVAFNGFSTVTEFGDIEKIEANPMVKKVYLSNEYSRPEVQIDMSTSNLMIDADKAWAEYELRGEGTVVAIIDSGIDPSHDDFVLSDETVPALTKNSVDNLGLPGVYFSEKVPYAYNYYDLSNKVVDLSLDGQHGQHVAGTVGANGLIKGVAPETQLLGMKVFSDDILYATTFSDIYLKAIDDAILLGADAINMSLGSPAGFYVEDSMEDVALTNALNNGIVTAISAGNERNVMYGASSFASLFGGNYLYAYAKNPDTGVVGTPSLNPASLSVASINNTNMVVNKLVYTIDGVTSEVQTSPAIGAPDGVELGSVPVKFVGTGTVAEIADKDLTGYVALIMRGGNTFVEKLENAQNAGAIGVIVFNHASGGEAQVNMAGGELAKGPFTFIGHAAGQAMADALAAQKEVFVTFTTEKLMVVNPLGGLMSDFSSWGPTPDLSMKPEITAPGGDIYSTQNNDTYGNMSGTSMAAPHVSGALALVQQRLKNDDRFSGLTAYERASLAKILLMNTAQPILDEYDFYYTVRQQGAGLMNVANALHSEVYVLDTQTGLPKVELGSVPVTNFSRTLTLTNTSDRDVTYLVYPSLLSEYILSAPDGQVYDFESSNQFFFETGQFNFSGAQEVVVPAGSSVDYSFTIDYSPVVVSGDLLRNQFVEGFIEFINKDGSQVNLTMPYLGFYGDWEEPKVVDELLWNNQDSDVSNDALFEATTPVFLDPMSGSIYLHDPRESIYINPGNPISQFTGTNQIGMLMTFLRNAREVNYRVLDDSGEVIREVGQSNYVRKLSRMNRGAAPYSYYPESVWDGSVHERNLEEAEHFTYQVEVLRTLNSPAQTMNFDVVIDNLGPEIFGVDYDPETYTLSLDAQDDGVGLYNFIITNLFNPDLVIYGGQSRYGYDQNLLAVDGQTHYATDIRSILDVEQTTNLEIWALDELNNITAGIIAVEGVRAEDAVEVVTPPESPEEPTQPDPEVPVREDDPYTQGQIVLEAPGLLDAYNRGDTQVNGVAYGWEVIRELTMGNDIYGKTDIALTPTDKMSVINPLTGAELFYGTAYPFDQVVDLNDNYYEMPFKITNHDDVSLQIVRRFWVDTTAPTLNVEVLERDSNSSTAKIKVSGYDAFSYLTLNRDDNYLAVEDWTSKGFDTRDVQLELEDVVSLNDGANTFTYYLRDIADNLTEVSVTVMKVDKAKLEVLLLAVSNLEKSAALQAAYDQGVEVYNNVMATQEEVDLAVENLLAALDPNNPINIPPVISGAASMTVYVGDEVDLRLNVVATDDQDGDLTAQMTVTPETVDTSFVGVTPVTYSVTDSHGNTTTVEIMVEVVERPLPPVDKINLAKAVQNAIDELAYNDYTDESVAAIQAAIEAGQMVLDNPNATQEEVDTATLAIQSALSSAQLNVKVDKSKLQSLVDKVKAMDMSKLKPKVVKALNEAVVAAEVVLNNPDATQQDVDAALEALVAVVNEATVGDKSELEAKLEEAKAIDTSNKTAYSVKMLEKAIKDAEKVLKDNKATQAQVDDAVNKLQLAIDNLEDKPSETKPNPPINPPTKPNPPQKPNASETVSETQQTTTKPVDVQLTSGVVTVKGNTDTLPKDAQLVAHEVDKTYPNVSGKAYEIHITKENSVVQPKGKVTVEVKLSDAEKQANPRVMYDDNGTLVDMKSVVDKDVVRFETDHFSVYVVQVDTPQTTTTTTTRTNPLPNTGQEDNTLLFVGSMTLISLGAILLVSRKRKEN